MKSYRINMKSQMKHLWSSVLITVLLPFLVYYLSIYKRGYFELELAVWIGGIGFLSYFLPVLLIHLKYYLHDRKNSFTYRKSSGEIIYHRDLQTIAFKDDEIKEIIVFKSRPLSESRTLILPWDEYHYAIIELKDGRQLKISSLLVYELDKVLKFENTEVKKTFYAWMS